MSADSGLSQDVDMGAAPMTFLQRAQFKVLGVLPFIRHNWWAGLATLTKALIQLMMLKLTAVYLGSAALGVLGQALSCLVIFQSLSSGGVTNYLITQLSKLGVEDPERSKVLASVGLWAVLSQVFFFVFCILFSEVLSQLLFSSDDFSWFFLLLSFCFLIFTNGAAALGVLSTQSRVKDIFYSSVASLAIGSVAFYLLIQRFAIQGALIGALIVLLLQSLAMFLYSYWSGEISLSWLKPRFHSHQFAVLLKFSLVILVTGALGSLYQVYMRTYLTSLGVAWEQIGHWQSILKISEISMSFLGISILSSYFPRISAIQNLNEMRKLVKSYGIKFMGLVLICCLVIGLFAREVLWVVFTQEYMELASLLRLQLLGDFFRLSAWTFSYFFMAKVPLRFFIGYELFAVGTLSISSIYLAGDFGIPGLIYSYLISAILSFGVAFGLFKWLSRDGGYIEQSLKGR